MKKLNKKGFTLVELLAVIIILGLLMVVAASVMGNVQDNAKKSTLETEAKKIMTSLTNEAKSLALFGEITSANLTGEDWKFKGQDGDYYYKATINKTTGEIVTFKMCLGKFVVEPTGTDKSVQEDSNKTCGTGGVHDSSGIGVSLSS